MTIAARVDKVLHDHGAHYKLISHRASGSTHESAEAAHVRDDHIAKAVVVRDGEDRALVVIPGDTWVDLKALANETARPYVPDVESDLGQLFPDCEPGAVPPSALPTPWRPSWTTLCAAWRPSPSRPATTPIWSGSTARPSPN